MAEIKRVNYFTSQFLVEKDFQDEQSYHRDMRYRHNRELHSAGIVGAGLQVSQKAAREVSITKGLAIDNKGQEIVLVDDTAYTLEITDPGPVYVTIEYADVNAESDRYSAPGAPPDKFIRTTERPKLRTTKTPPPITSGSLVLAKLTLDANGITGRVDSAPPERIAIGGDIKLRFDPATGHDHDGVDSKKISVTDLVIPSPTRRTYIPLAPQRHLNTDEFSTADLTTLTAPANVKTNGKIPLYLPPGAQLTQLSAAAVSRLASFVLEVTLVQITITPTASTETQVGKLVLSAPGLKSQVLSHTVKNETGPYWIKLFVSNPGADTIGIQAIALDYTLTQVV
jgi:hypothetical protein